jgi:hypothetical protein
VKFHSFEQMAYSEEEWECPSCHNVAYVDDADRALIALGYGRDVKLKCRCGTEALGNAVTLHESGSYRFSED